MMDIDEDELLRTAANGGSVDYSIWPALLPRIVSRIERITRNEFPIPRLPPPPTIIPSSIPPTQPDSESAENFLSPLPSSPIEPSSSSSSQDTNKENTPIAPRMNPPPTSTPTPAVALPPGTLPPQITSMLNEITSTLTTIFPKYPPHTLQRLSELVIAPKHHYRTLPTYLHALDRVVHVTSGLNTYPLPPAVPDMKSASLLSNGVSDALAAPSPFASPGSDEALGGALLTPIPWLQPNHHGMSSHSPSLGTPGRRSPNRSNSPNNNNNGVSSSILGTNNNSGGDLEGEVRTESTETIDGPNGVGSIETVSVSVNGIPSMGARGVGVTQGELLRQEQRAGVVPVSQLVPSHHVHSGGAHAQAHRRASASPSPEPGQGPSGEETKERSPPAAAEGGEAEAGVATATTTVDADAPVGSVTGADEEKPHARGPEEIGPEDMGPQHGSGSNTGSVGGPGGFEMQGIDVEAAVGRKASSGHGGSGSPPKTNSPPLGDKMDVETEGNGSESDAGARTPKHEAEDELEGGESKKLKENTEGEEKGNEAAMDTSVDENKEGGSDQRGD
ncbi:uncharacterized protein F4822DRAFT_426051 [Hypoxylon trugodes]|uniref:uncharacterized protein n=1 Tax=Hypoxylon trugodes TaxID=326681 RepID=UPI00219FF42C|nr:uncharacterized protein F4822DRAFT_426051 [Hypoxylon trugodes]KAI1392847.1 hypothetical protein F4822DRAFT_426051 [Hypoxylon trugodes]